MSRMEGRSRSKSMSGSSMKEVLEAKLHERDRNLERVGGVGMNLKVSFGGGGGNGCLGMRLGEGFCVW